MTIQDFENALHSDCFEDWMMSNFGLFITPGAPRAAAIRDQIVVCMGIPTITTHIMGLPGAGYLDIFDAATNNIGKCAHTGLYNNVGAGGPIVALTAINNIVQDYFCKLAAGYNSEFFGIVILLDVENLDPASPFNGIPFPRRQSLDLKVETENNLMLLLGRIKIHEPFHRIKDLAGKESTILNYDIYVVKFEFSNANSKHIYDNFKDKLNYFQNGDFDETLLEKL